MMDNPIDIEREVSLAHNEMKCLIQGPDWLLYKRREIMDETQNKNVRHCYWIVKD